MPLDPRLIPIVREEWRELGFYCNFERERQRWVFVGSRAGLQAFSWLLHDYAADPLNAQVSEHEHYGPYTELKIMTWPESGIDDGTIFGPLSELHRLAALIDEKLASHGAGETFVIAQEFAPASGIPLHFEIREEGFDPASADPQL